MLVRLLGLCAFGALALSLFLTNAGARTEKRVALVIGNSDYGGANVLTNPTRDAVAIADLFRRAHFDKVEEHPNLTNQAMHRVLRQFAEIARGADVAVVYYAGHGIQYKNRNYLIPIDAELAIDADIEDETLSLDRILEAIDGATRLRVVILDACRDNPFEKNMRRSADRSYTTGLALVETVWSNTVIAFAAKAGKAAEDGLGAAHSPFVTALLDNLSTPGVDIHTIFDDVHDQVMKATGKKQEPYAFYSPDVTAKVQFILGVAAVATPPIGATPSIDRDYDRAASIGTAQAWDLFIENYNGLPQAKFYLDLARAARTKAIATENQKEAERAAQTLEAKSAQLANKKAEEAEWAAEARRQAEARAQETRRQSALVESRQAEEVPKKVALAAVAEEARKAAEQAKAAEMLRKIESDAAAEEARRTAENARRAEQARKQAEEASRAERARRDAEIAKHNEEERKKTVLVSLSSESQVPTPSKFLEMKAQRFLDEYIKQSQSGPEPISAYTKRAYAGEVEYYGKLSRNSKIVTEQIGYAKTWPERTFLLKVGMTRISCDSVTSACDISGEIDFHNVNPAKLKSSTGVASFALRVLFNQSEPKIVLENGKVLTRQATIDASPK